VNRFSGGISGSLQNLLDDEVTLSRRCRTDVKGLIGHSDVKGAPVGIRIDGNGGDSHFPAGPNDPDGNLSSVRDKYFLEHG